MSDERQIDSIFCAAVELRSPSERAAYLDRACGRETELRRRVNKLLAAHAQVGDFMEDPDNPDATIDQAIAEQPGTIIGPYKLLQIIGQGGMGVVYMAEQSEPVARRVALKIIKPGMDTGQVIARFEAERQALAMMDHPNIAKVLDAGATDSGRPYFVMELVKGIPISEYCDEQHFTPKERLVLFVKVCHAVQHAHQKGIIHRDLKPSNVLVAEYDHQAVPKIIDFGVAKATSQKLTEKTMFTQYGQIVGTLEYMSPEQAKLNQLDIDTRSDVYSLGVLLYHLLTGTTPFERERLQSAAFDEMLRIIREEEPPKPSTRISTLGKSAVAVSGHRRTSPQKLQRWVQGELDWIVMRSLEKERSRRYESASSFAADIERFLDDEAVEACPPSTAYRARKFLSRYRGPVSALAAILVLLCLGLVGTSLGIVWARKAEKRATDALGRAEQLSERNKQLADEQTALAEGERTARKETEEQLRISRVMRLAVQSESIRKELPAQSVLLAIEAVESTRIHDGSVIPIAHETLLNATSAIGGLPLGGHGLGGGWALSFSADGHWLVTAGSTDGIARLWDFTSNDPGSSSLVLRGHEETIRGCAFSPDGRWLATVSGDKTARLWDLSAEDLGTSSLVLRGHERRVVSLAVSPDSRWLVTGSADTTARLWDLTAEDPAASPVVLRGHDDRISAYAATLSTSVGFSPDGRWVVTGSWDKTARLWDLTAEDPAASPVVLRGHEGRVSSLAISPDSRWLVTGSEDKTARLWDLTAEDPAASPIVLRGHDEEITSVTISSDGRWLATTSWDKTARLWNLTVDDTVASSVVLPGHEDRIHSVAISPDGRWLITGSHDRTARLWDLTVEDPAKSSVVLRGHEDAVVGLVVSPNSHWLVTGSWDAAAARLWDLTDLNPASASVLRAHQDRVSSVAISPDGRWLATASWDNTARLWSLSDEGATSSVRVLRHENRVKSLAISPDSRWLVTGSWDKTARLWDLTAEDPSVSSAVLTGHKDGIESVTISTDGKWLASGSRDKTVRLWDLTSKDVAVSPPRILRGHPSVVGSVAISPDGRWLVAAEGKGSEDPSGKTAALWDLSSDHSDSLPLFLRGHREHIWCTAISADSHWLVTGSADSTARLWDLTAEDPTASFRVLQHESNVPSVAFSPDCRWLATASLDRRARLWDLTTEDPARSPLVLHGHGAYLWSLGISPDGRWLVTGNGLGVTRLWDLSAEHPGSSSLVLRGHESGVIDVAVSPDGRWVATGSDDKTVRLWDLDVDSVLDRARRAAGRELTAEEKGRYMISGP